MSDSQPGTATLLETITAWQCVGCGRIESAQNCVGVCQDRKVELVSAWTHAEALVALEEAQARIANLTGLVGKLAHTTPRGESWKQTYLALQTEAREILSKRRNEHEAA